MDNHWFALWVKSRHEFVTAKELMRKGVDNFVPSVSRVRQWKDRKKIVDFPLFPGYLFVHIASEPEKFLKVVQTQGAVRFVSLEPGHPTPVPSEDIAALKVMIECGEQVDVFPAIKKGMLVRVKRGPLNGSIGVLEERQSQHMFLINFDILGRSVGVKISSDDVEKA